MADEIELQPHPSGSQQDQQDQDDQVRPVSPPRGPGWQVAPNDQKQAWLIHRLKNFFHRLTHSPPFFDLGSTAYYLPRDPIRRIDHGDDEVLTDSQQPNQHYQDGEPSSKNQLLTDSQQPNQHHQDGGPSGEPLSWNLPNDLMNWDYRRDYHDRTALHMIIFGPATPRAPGKDGYLHHKSARILCARKRPWNHIVLGEAGAVPVERQLGPTYLILGLFSSRTTVPQEICIPIWPRHDLALAIKRGARTLRGVGGIFSLKYVSGFSIYQCHVKDGFHSRVELDMRTENTLSQLYADSLGYSGRDKDEHCNFTWKPWIQIRLNSKTYEPKHGRYSLELKLSWSPFRIVALASTPIALSLAIGIWYMKTSGQPAEKAWVIASYIATAGGVLVAIIAAVVALRQQ